MELKYFELLLKNNNAIRLTNEIMLFNDLELYDLITMESVYFENFDELYNHEINGQTIKELVLNTDVFYNQLDGGRGAEGPMKMGGGFTSARGGGLGGGIGAKLFPATFNTGGKFRSLNKTLNAFANKYKNADIEYGITVDKDGFVHEHIQGGTTSVNIIGGKGQVVIHNHPSGGAFSKADLLHVASTNEHGIVAVGNKGNYILTKTKTFQSKEFIKAVNKAQWPIKYDYDKGADWWLKKNAKKFGYNYSFVS